MKRQNDNTTGTFKKIWLRIPLVIRAILTGLLISTLGVATWTIIGMNLPMPWSFILMIPLLVIYLLYFSGKFKPESTKNIRVLNFRRIALPRRIWILSLLAAAFIVLIEQSGLVVTFRLNDFPAEQFSMEYSFIESIPPWAGWLAIIMISLVAGICEEVGFRGYMQVPLEKKYSPVLAISIVSVVFVLMHLHQAWSGPILVHIFVLSVLFGTIAYFSQSLIPGIIAHFVMDVCNFAFWWTDLGGQFDREPIQSIGMDIHFILWLIVLISSLIAFVAILRHIRKNYNRQSS